MSKTNNRPPSGYASKRLTAMNHLYLRPEKPEITESVSADELPVPMLAPIKPSGARDEYSEAEAEFLRHCDRWRGQRKGRIVTNVEAFRILLSMGYRLVSPVSGEMSNGAGI